MKALVGKLLATAPLIHCAPTLRGFIKQTKYCLRGLALARQTREWFEFLQQPEMAFIVQNNPCLFHKLQRPYLTRILGTGERLEAIKEHYQFVLANFSAAMIEDVYAPAGMVLLEWRLEKAGTLELRLLCGKMQKEGDLTLCLVNKETGNRVATLSFSIRKCKMFRKVLFIGGLQGDKATSEETVVAITRGLYGLRPKALLFYVVQELAAYWGITHLQAVSDDLHIYRHFQSRRNVNASYDAFWEECGGIHASDGVFDLPVAFVPRDILTIRANKRQQYRRRYLMLEAISDQILAHLSGDTEIFQEQPFVRPVVVEHTVSEPVVAPRTVAPMAA